MARKRFSVTVDQEIYDHWKAFAKADFRSMGSLTLASIEEYIHRKEGEQKRLETIRRRRMGYLSGDGRVPVSTVRASTP